MSNPNHNSRRQTQPEWNAPLVSLPDISQILNGAADASDSIPISTCETSKSSPSGQVSNSYVEEFDASHLEPVAASGQSAEKIDSSTVQEPASHAEAPAAKSVVGEDPSENLNETKYTKLPKIEPAHLLKAIGAANSKWIKTALIYIGTIAATVVALNYFNGRSDSRLSDAARAERKPLHDQPLANPELEIPVVQLESDESSEEVVVSLEDPGSKPVSDAHSLVAEANVSQSLPDAFHHAPETASTRPIVPHTTSAVAEVADTFERATTESANPSGLKNNTSKNFRHIQRYQPTQGSILQPPMNSGGRPQQTKVASPRDHSSLDSRHQTNTPRQVTESNSNAEQPYYERTTPESYLYPEDAVARAIGILRNRARQ